MDLAFSTMQTDLQSQALAQASQLQERLSGLLHDPTSAAAPPPSTATAAPQHHTTPDAAGTLAALLSTHAQMRRLALSAAAPPHDEDLAAAVAARNAALARLAAQLAAAVAALRGALDAAYALRKLPAPSVDPDQIVAYAHRLRYGYFPLGTTPGLWRDPPAPQVCTTFSVASPLSPSLPHCGELPREYLLYSEAHDMARTVTFPVGGPPQHGHCYGFFNG